MRLHWLPVTFPALLILSYSINDSQAQLQERNALTPMTEHPASPPISNPSEIPPAEVETEPEAADAAMADEHHLPKTMPAEQQDSLTRLAELREAVRISPRSASTRLNLSQGLYQIGDLDAAIDEARVAIKWNPDDARAHLHLGIILMAKQDWRAALSVLKEATRLDPELVQAHYSLGKVQYSLGNSNSAIEAYRRALELQPNFPDAKYQLGLLLKLTKQYREGARLMAEAADSGIPQAQFFLGNAFKSGQGVEKNLGLAVFWWMRAMDFGHQPAADALSKLRRQALSNKQDARTRKEALEAFKAYRDKLWEEFPEYDRLETGTALGTKLLHDNRPDDALPVLFREAYAMSEEAQIYLARLYESGWDKHLTPFDQTILSCLETTAADGFLPAKKLMARIYGKGLGVEQDLRKAKTLLKGLPKQEIQSLLDELDAS